MTTSELSNDQLRRRIAELEAKINELEIENIRLLHDKADLSRWVAMFESEGNEARQWAQCYRRRYLHVKHHIVKWADTYRFINLGWLPSDDIDSTPF
jgi:hypothetical protein